ncbi:spore cortex-lytic enzyme [Scopulibacillus cellulosilyticus]|uniref:Spore cortex-lytic enzyme n=1 Tax=Scopulibacillus cellulosilyticus TaxID=2665665 RepID=A0ABW2PR07_9BACL
MLLKRQLYLAGILTFLIMMGGLCVDSPRQTEAFTSQVIHQGSVGNDVIELQSRLQYIGFYHGKIDGVFGWSTYWALRNFQEKFGLKVDGMAGLKTRQKLVAVTKYNYRNQSNSYAANKNKNQGNTNANQNNNQSANQNIPKGFSQSDINLMANAVYGEARGEPFVGQVAVAAVILHRVESPKFPNTVSGVIFQPGAFTAVSDGQIWLTPNAEAKKAVIDAINGWDPTHDAMYYFNPDTATSAWIWSRPQILKIGKHIFTK